MPKPNLDEFAEVSRLLGTQLRAARKARGLTQEELALRVGKDRRTIQQLEYGRATTPDARGGYGPSNPQLDTIWRLALALDVDITALLKPEGPAAAERGPSK